MADCRDIPQKSLFRNLPKIRLKIYRKFVYSKKEEDKGISELIISKHRNGPTGTVKLAFIDEYAKFQNYDFAHDNDFIDSHDINDVVFE